MYLFSFISSFGWHMKLRKRGRIVHSHSPDRDGCFYEGVHQIQGQLLNVNTLSENRTPACLKVKNLVFFILFLSTAMQYLVLFLLDSL